MPNDVRLTTFEAIYRNKLAAAIEANPTAYRYGAEAIPDMAAKLVSAIRVHGVNAVDIKGKAVQATLKALQVKLTYKAWRDYIDGGDTYSA